MLRFDTIVGDIPYLLLGIPLTLGITAVAFVVGILIALPEIMNRGWLLAAQNFRPIEVLTTIALIYIVVTWPLALLAAYLERRSGFAFRSD